MSSRSKSLLSVRDLSPESQDLLFSRCHAFKHEYEQKGSLHGLLNFEQVKNQIMAQIYFEPSTRTRESFKMAALRLGIKATQLSALEVSSVKKGESFVDTVRTIEAMKPNILVVRHSGDVEVREVLSELSLPVINAGDGGRSHPTQALLDAFTLREKFEKFDGLKLLFIGDGLHSRVARSNLTLLSRRGVKFGFCGPQPLRPKDEEWSQVQYFSNLTEGLSWAQVCMSLRIQKERHKDLLSSAELEAYSKEFCLNKENLQFLPATSVIMHPGPHILGEDITLDVLKDSRCLMRTQVTNGVFMRAALLSHLLELEISV